jgi:hypothetical protein
MHTRATDDTGMKERPNHDSSGARVAVPMPALSQVVTGEIVPTCAWATGANRGAIATLTTTAARTHVRAIELKNDVSDVPVFEFIT